MKSPCPLGRKRRPIGPKRRPLGVRQGPFRVRKCTLLRTPSGHVRKSFSPSESQIEDGRKFRFCEGEERYWPLARSILLCLMPKARGSYVGFSLSRARVSNALLSAPRPARSDRLMLSRSIQGRELIHPFPWRSCRPPPGVVASLLFLMPSTPSRTHFCATDCSHSAAPTASSPKPPAGLCRRFMPYGCRQGMRLIHFSLGPAFRVAFAIALADARRAKRSREGGRGVNPPGPPCTGLSGAVGPGKALAGNPRLPGQFAVARAS